MNKKILVSLIILGVFFVGSATYALFNENILLNDVTSDIQSNDTSVSNNQPQIPNGQPDTILNSENLNLHHNNGANIILNDIGVVNGDVGQKVVKEVFRATVNDVTQIFYDDDSFIVIRDNHTYCGKAVLTRIYDTKDISGGYVVCSDCGNFIPVGDVSELVPENYLCNCPDEHPTSVKDVPWVYSEESVLEYIKNNRLNNAFDDSSNVDMGSDVDIDSNDVNQNSTVINNNIDKPEFKIPDDFKLPNTNPWEVDIDNYHGMDMNNYRNIFVFEDISNDVSGD